MPMQKPPLWKRAGRLFVIKSRWEAWAVTWAIALGAVERGKHYLALYPGTLGWIFFLICCAVVFVAGAKLLDATRPVPAPALRPLSQQLPRRRRPVSRIRPTRSAAPGSGASRSSRRTD